jgi:hypothetical protein
MGKEDCCRMLTYLLVCWIVAIVEVRCAFKAPLGFQDETGWHRSEEPILSGG